MRTIKLVSYYSNWNDKYNRTASPAGINVINYLANVIAGDEEYSVEIISPSWITSAGKTKLIKKQKVTSDRIRITYTPSYVGSGKLICFVNKVISRMWLIAYLIKNIKSREPIIVYHEPSLIFPIRLLRFLKHPYIIMLTEELYSTIPKFSGIGVGKEINYLHKSDAFIFPTILLNDAVNLQNKLYLILHGMYNVEKDRKTKFNDGKIHVLYAGTFNHTKGGATAVAVAEFLDERYCMHIIGFGSKEDTQFIVDKVNSIQLKTKCIIHFDGLKKGEEYIKYIQSCDIGLSPQNPTEPYNDSSFPSKVLSYLCNGLRVASVKIKALQTSAISDMLTYYESSEPKAIADAIKTIDMSKKYDSRAFLLELNHSFSKSLIQLINCAYKR